MAYGFGSCVYRIAYVNANTFRGFESIVDGTTVIVIPIGISDNDVDNDEPEEEEPEFSWEHEGEKRQDILLGNLAVVRGLTSPGMVLSDLPMAIAYLCTRWGGGDDAYEWFRDSVWIVIMMPIAATINLSMQIWLMVTGIGSIVTDHSRPTGETYQGTCYYSTTTCNGCSDIGYWCWTTCWYPGNNSNCCHCGGGRTTCSTTRTAYSCTKYVMEYWSTTEEKPKWRGRIGGIWMGWDAILWSVWLWILIGAD